jgi:F0F1-type ATP synthase membrane subunit c/vacuolar-type H+-ATPase subunit K
MGNSGRVARLAVWAAGAMWMAFWFWAFSFAYSDSFFAYDRHSRLPVFAAALLGAGGILGSAVAQWRAVRSVVGACLRHAVGVAASLCPLVAVSALQRQAGPPWRPSADDAMGVGIDFLLLMGAGIASLAVLASGLTVRKLWLRRVEAAPDGMQSR